MDEANRLCECPDRAFDHSAGRCPGVAWYRVERKGAVLALCGQCTLSGDRLLGELAG